MKRLGLVGVGAWGRRYIDTIGRRTDCSIAAYARATRTRLEGIPGASACDDWRSLVELAARAHLDGVIAATTPAHQLEVTSACIAAGVPLLVEKPLGLSRPAVEDLRARFAASQQKAPVVVDYVHLWAPAFVELKRRVSGRTSEIRDIRAEGFNQGPLRSWSSLYDYGPHDVSMCLDVLGEEAAFVLHRAERIGSSTPGIELFDARFELGGVPVHLRVGNGGATRARKFAVALADDREIIYDDTRPPAGKLTDGGTPVAIDEGRALDVVLTSFLASVTLWREGRLPEHVAGASLGFSANVNGILDAIAAGSASSSPAARQRDEPSSGAP